MVSVLALSDAKAHLNISVNTHDAELQATIDAAEAVIAERCGPLQSTTVTTTVYGNSATLLLPVTPVVSVTSVTPYLGTALTAGDLYTNLGAGIVSYYSGGAFSATQHTVVYQAGRAECPADLLMAVRELVRHLWTSQRGSARPGPGAPEPTPGAAYLLPHRVSELIAPHVQMSIA